MVLPSNPLMVNCHLKFLMGAILASVKLTNEILERAGYNVKTKNGDRKTMSKSKSATSGLKKVTLDLLDAEGEIKEQWELNNAFVKAAKFGDLDYSNDELRQVTLTLKYDWATCTINAEQEKTFFTTSAE